MRIPIKIVKRALVWTSFANDIMITIDALTSSSKKLPPTLLLRPGYSTVNLQSITPNTNSITRRIGIIGVAEDGMYGIENVSGVTDESPNTTMTITAVTATTA